MSENFEIFVAVYIIATTAGAYLTDRRFIKLEKRIKELENRLNLKIKK